MYFSYHKTVKKLLSQNKLNGWYISNDHNGIKPALVILFNDIKHPVMPIRLERWHEYVLLLPKEKQLEENSN